MVNEQKYETFEDQQGLLYQVVGFEFVREGNRTRPTFLVCDQDKFVSSVSPQEHRQNRSLEFSYSFMDVPPVLPLTKMHPSLGHTIEL